MLLEAVLKNENEGRDCSRPFLFEVSFFLEKVFFNSNVECLQVPCRYLLSIAKLQFT